MQQQFWSLVIYVLIPLACIAPFLYLWICLEDDIHKEFDQLPMPSNIFRARLKCYLSPVLKRGWAKRLKKECPRINIKAEFTTTREKVAQFLQTIGSFSTDFDTLPLFFPQVATRCMLIELLAHSAFPTSLRRIRMEKLCIVQVRSIKTDENLNCLMMLIRRVLTSEGVILKIQTDLFDETSTVWQSTLELFVPVSLKVPPGLKPTPPFKDVLLSSCTEKPHQVPLQLSCLPSVLKEWKKLGEIPLPDSFWTVYDFKFPMTWALSFIVSHMQREKMIPAYPVMFDCIFPRETAQVDISERILIPFASNPEKTLSVCTILNKAEQLVAKGVIRSVKWGN